MNDGGCSSSNSSSRNEDDDVNTCAVVLFEVNLSYQGKTNHSIQVSSMMTGFELYQETIKAVFGIITNNENGTILDDDNNKHHRDGDDEMVKLLFKGKRIQPHHTAFPFKNLRHLKKKNSNSNKPFKILVMATNRSMVEELSHKRSDPLLRGFDQEKEIIDKRKAAQTASHGGGGGGGGALSTSSGTQYWNQGGGSTRSSRHYDYIQDRQYKFCKLKSCTKHAFGHHRSSSNNSNSTGTTDHTAPHEFKARELLEILVTDPGVVAIMQERELVVSTLGEMDPIDDRIMQKMQHDHGDQSCLLGYNTNHGLRIDLKLRSENLQEFRPYPQLVSTLIHELSHNWIGDHSLLFWTNYAQMRIEYLYTHHRLRRHYGTTNLYKLAGLTEDQLENIFGTIMKELVIDMRQHGLHPNMIINPIRQRLQQLEQEDKEEKHQTGGYRLGGGGNGDDANSATATATITARERSLAAAERRAREYQERDRKEER